MKTVLKRGSSHLQGQVDALKTDQINTVEVQISSILSSVSTLQDTEQDLRNYIFGMESQSSEIYDSLKTVLESLRGIDTDLLSRIDSLKSYADSGIKDWVNTTFATLDQYDSTAFIMVAMQNQLETIKSSIDTLNENSISKLEESIAKSKESIKSWINDKFDAYYTAAQIDCELTILKEQLNNKSADDRKETEKRISEFENKLTSAKEEISEAYTDAISKAIEAYNGTITAEIASKISEVNTRITALQEDVDDLKGRVSELEDRVSELGMALNNLTAIAYIPRYSDYTERVQYSRNGIDISSNDVRLRFRVYPASIAQSIADNWKSVLSASAVYTETRSSGGQFFNLEISAATANDGVLTVTIAAPEFGRDFIIGTLGVSAVLAVSSEGKCTMSEYVRLAPDSDTDAELTFIKYLVKNFDTNSNGTIEEMEAASATEFFVPSYIKTVDDVLIKMPNLEYIYCGSDSEVTSLDLSHMTKLTKLDLQQGSDIKKLDVSNTKLTDLNIPNLRYLTELNVKNVGTLQTLVGSAPLTTLNISGLPNLKSLKFQGAKITTLDLTGITKLDVLDITGNSPDMVICESLEWILSVGKISEFMGNIFYTPDKKLIDLEKEEAVIDGKTWKKFNAGATVCQPNGIEFAYQDATSWCPIGYRIPTKSELESLSAHYSEWTNYHNKDGHWFSGSKAYSDTEPSIFLPAFPNKKFGYYWSSDEYNTSLRYILHFRLEKVQIIANNNTTGYLRCIKDE